MKMTDEMREAARARGRELAGNHPRVLVEAMAEIAEQGAIAVLTAAPASVEPVKVKPLEWEDCGELGWCADTIVGRYWVEQVHVAFRTRLVTLVAENETWIDIVDGKGFEAAKNAAQADYEARVRSALAVAS